MTSADYAEADEKIRRMVEKAQQLGTNPHRVDTTRNLSSAFRDADVLISDVSAVALNWLPTSRPLIVTTPQPSAEPSKDQTLDRVAARLSQGQAASICSVVRGLPVSGSVESDFQEVISHYFTTIAPGAATANFVQASMSLGRWTSAATDLP